MVRKKREQYLDGAVFFEEMISFKEKYDLAVLEGRTPPSPNDYIGMAILKIATKLATKPNFSKYTFKEEMIGDGVENALRYIANYDPEKSKTKNPFSYFTQIIYFAFLRRIEKEKKELYTRYKSTEAANIFGGILDQQNSDDSHYAVQIQQNTAYMDDFVKTFEENLDKKKVEKEVAEA